MRFVQTLLEQTEAQAMAAKEAAAVLHRRVQGAVGGGTLATAVGLLVCAAMLWREPPEEVVLTAVALVCAASCSYELLLPEVLLLARTRSVQDAAGTAHFHHHHGGHHRDRARACEGLRATPVHPQQVYEMRLGLPGEGHRAVRVRHCADDLAEEAMMKASEKLPQPGRRSSMGAAQADPARFSACRDAHSA